MAKMQSRFFCKECGYESSKWLGQCPGCHIWNSFVEEPLKNKTVSKTAPFKGQSNGITKPVRIEEIDLTEEDRMLTGFQELDRVLGGGIVAGSLVLLGGDPGIGKSTILLEVARNLTEGGDKSALYVSGEESLKQIRIRAQRITEIHGDLRFLSETNIERIIEIAQEYKPDFVVIDSIQTMFTESISSTPGSVGQIRESAAALLRFSKEMGTSVFVIGHVTKDGNVAGPKILEHMVDAVLYFQGENGGSLRILYGQKNRFGSTNEIAVFEMTDKGLKEVSNPSEMLLSGRPLGVSGSVVTCGMEGTRPVLIEIQGLAVPTSFGLPRRTSNGADYNRVNLLLAIIERRIGLPLSKYDAYINIAGGIRVTEPATDLAIVMSLISSLRDMPIPADCIIFGEVGLTGEVRAVSNTDKRIEEAVRLGFHKILFPAWHAEKYSEFKNKGIDMFPVKNIREALTIMSK